MVTISVWHLVWALAGRPGLTLWWQRAAPARKVAASWQRSRVLHSVGRWQMEIVDECRAAYDIGGRHELRSQASKDAGCHEISAGAVVGITQSYFASSVIPGNPCAVPK
ncbi:hypothetical protein SS50377_25333 [Spironucleus salmonicida]|uniref:Uncharacterized protein n=1 Tax=Spironucleus salmonicida TaxID=348837 RepID=A0A9P8LRW0_9EUKA|nr:hypothetical protein SS50377_25325 [Spironucleus salmonicida]KAH0573213.1 hypothetical protein SS50377_25333 [Spironucleus salmonicida]